MCPCPPDKQAIRRDEDGTANNILRFSFQPQQITTSPFLRTGNSSPLLLKSLEPQPTTI